MKVIQALNTYILPVILISIVGLFVVGFVYYQSQARELGETQKKLKEVTAKEVRDKEQKEFLRSCLDNADRTYYETLQGRTIYENIDFSRVTPDVHRQADIDSCYKQYETGILSAEHLIPGRRLPGL